MFPIFVPMNAMHSISSSGSSVPTALSSKIFSEIQALKRRILPNERVVLFGSQARGDANEDSDWDLLVLLNKEKRNYSEDYDNYAYPFAEIGLKYNKPISIQLFTAKDWERQKPSIFYKNVEQEGVEII